MGCSACSTNGNGSPKGCKSNGGCASGGCNRLNTYDWLATMDIAEPNAFDIVEVSFKNGSRKQFFRNELQNRTTTGDWVVVETGSGFDVGKISLSGELVRMQMRKKRVSEDAVTLKIVRIANQRDMERLEEARALEHKTMVRARAIARTLDLEMKIGDVEYQGDRRKATFFYTADGRVDFRELIRHFAKEFRVKIEMRQIGARQESARIGGLGSCGRELCCSTWLTDFKSVSTAAARYQNLAINQAKLSGQCGRLKCCLNYELDSYIDALEEFPKNADKLKTEVGTATLVKTDIFKKQMFYVYERGDKRGKLYSLHIERVHTISALNAKGEYPSDLVDIQELIAEEAMDYGDVTGAVELPPEEKKKRRRKNRRNRDRSRQKQQPQNKTNSGGSQKSAKDSKSPDTKAPTKGNRNKRNRNNRNRKNRNNRTTNRNNNNQNKGD